MAATREDAALIVQMLRWGAQIDIQDAFARIYSDDFDPQTATHRDPAVAKVLGFGEAIGTFVKHGLLDNDLVQDLWAINSSWKRIAPAALRAREHSGEPRLYENYEALARKAPVPA